MFNILRRRRVFDPHQARWMVATKCPIYASKNTKATYLEKDVLCCEFEKVFLCFCNVTDECEEDEEKVVLPPVLLARSSILHLTHNIITQEKETNQTLRVSRHN